MAEGIEYAICEYLPGAEFTVDCFTDRHGALRLVSPRSRDRIRAGIAVRSRVFPADERIRSIAEDLNRRFSFNGAWFFQLKRNAAGDYRLMEAAPRIAGTMGATRNLGANLPLLTLYNLWGYDVELLLNDNALLVDRAFISRFQTDIAYDSVYVDFDDTLILGGNVNAPLMMFLYQAKNAGKSLYLLTRHACDVREELPRFGIAESLFDGIYWIQGDEPKARYIRPNSIFIDDSFAERKRVKEACGIPVFDLDMVESLLDWRA
ncbi:MAG: ATP-grasp domain-containing protein [Oscillospiraceae bacterium]|nr:ATP-grasp domain-containing protein [Oscillospiraceae bacterium]